MRLFIAIKGVDAFMQVRLGEGSDLQEGEIDLVGERPSIRWSGKNNTIFPGGIKRHQEVARAELLNSGFAATSGYIS